MAMPIGVPGQTTERALRAPLPYDHSEWWQKNLNVPEQVAKDARGYSMRFDRNGAIVSELIAVTRRGWRAIEDRCFCPSSSVEF